jgi:CRISPR-associated endoribonuclease Cas6
MMGEPQNEARLYAIVLRLGATRPGAVPADHGDQARAALLGLLRAGNDILATHLHDDNAHKPYTISLVWGGKRGPDHAQHFGEGSEAFWRFTLLCEPAFEALLRRYLLNRDLPHVRVGSVEFAILDAFASGLSHPESGHIALKELQARWDVSPNQLPRHMTLNFRSPTVFSLGGKGMDRRWQVMPDARITFSALRKRWAQLGGAEPGDTFDEWVMQHLTAEPLRLETRTSLIEGRPVPGFTGRVRYTARGDNCWLGLTHLLADLAFWTGVGYQTTRGMGQVRREANDNDSGEVNHAPG